MTTDARRGRLHRLTLLVAALAVAVSGAVTAWNLSGAPGIDAVGADLRLWLMENRRAVQWSVWASTIGIVPFLTLAALLKSLLPRPHSEIFGFGAVTVAVTGAIQSWFWAGLALRPREMAPETLRLVMDVAVHWGPVLTGAMIAMIAPVTILALARRAGLPRWLGWLGLFVGGEQAVETMTVFGLQGFASPGGAMNMQLGASLTLVWIMAFAACAARAVSQSD